MKRHIRRLLAAVALACTAFAPAQAQSAQPQPAKSKEPVVAPSYAWKLLSPLGLREEATIDTLFEDYSRRFIPSEVSDAWASTGNYGGPGMNMIFDERPAMSDFFFRDPLAHWLPSLDKTRFYNTRIPMTLLSFNSAGGRDIAQERLKAIFSGNIWVWISIIILHIAKFFYLSRCQELCSFLLKK